MSDDDQRVWTASCRTGSEAKLHTNPDCPALQRANAVYGPKPRAVYPDADLCSHCRGDSQPAGGQRDLYETLSDPGFGPEDVGLTEPPPQK